MANLTRKTSVLALNEAAYAASTTLDPTTDGLLLTGDGAGVYSVDTTVVDTPILRATVQPQSPLIGRTLANVNLSSYLMTSRKPLAAASEAAPWIDPILQGVGFGRSDGNDGADSSSAVYAPVATPVSTAFEVYADDLMSTVTGAYGSSMNFNFTAGSTATWDATFMGKYTEPVDNTDSISYPSDNKTLVESEVLTIGSYSPIVRSMAISMANTVSERADANDTLGFFGVELTGRSSSTLDLVIEVPDAVISTFNPWEKLYTAAGSGDTISFTHKTSATEMIVFTMTTPMLTSVSYADDGGVRMYNLSYALYTDDTATPSKEIEIIFKRKVT